MVAKISRFISSHDPLFVYFSKFRGHSWNCGGLWAISSLKMFSQHTNLEFSGHLVKPWPLQAGRRGFIQRKTSEIGKIDGRERKKNAKCWRSRGSGGGGSKEGVWGRGFRGRGFPGQDRARIGMTRPKKKLATVELAKADLAKVCQNLKVLVGLGVGQWFKFGNDFRQTWFGQTW